MPAAKKPLPYCAHANPQHVEDGTAPRVPIPAPVPAGTGVNAGAVRILESGECLVSAYWRALPLAPQAVLRETGYELGGVLKGLLPGLLQMLVALALTTFVGAGIGAAVGFVGFGVGAAPGAVVGGELGFDAGMAILSWLGVAFLMRSIGSGLGEMTALLSAGSNSAWQAGQMVGIQRDQQLHRAAQQIARAVGVLVRLLLEGIVAYLLKNAALQSTRAAMATSQAVRVAGTDVIAEQTVAELVAKLRASKLGDGFATWVEQNWNDLLENPRLRPKRLPAPSAGFTSSSGTSRAPSLRSEPAPGPAIREDPDSFLLAKKTGREPGAIPGNLPPHDVDPPVQPADPRFQIQPEDVDTFAETPKFETLPPGTKIYRVVGKGNDPAGRFWSLDPPPATESQWRAGAAVRNNWNGDGGYVMHEVGPGGLKVWKGAAAPQPAGVDGYYLPGGGTQLYVPEGQINPATLNVTRTPWSR